MFRGVLFFAWLIALLRFIQHFIIVSRKIIDKRTDGEELHVGCRMKADAALDAVAHQRATGWLLRGIFLVAPITFYFCVFLPCWECYDFEAAVTHEIGHVLGLSHPDELATTAPGRAGAPGGENTRLQFNLSSSEWDCHEPWASAVPVEAGAADRPSIMRALTQHNPRVCLSEDDLESLNVLYPDCSASVITKPVCYYANKNIGWTRFFAWTFVPIFVTMCLVIGLNECVRQRQGATARKLQNELMEEKAKKNKEVKQMVRYLLKNEEEQGGVRRSNKVAPDGEGGEGGHGHARARRRSRLGRHLHSMHLDKQIAQLQKTRAHEVGTVADMHAAAAAHQIEPHDGAGVLDPKPEEPAQASQACRTAPPLAAQQQPYPSTMGAPPPTQQRQAPCLQQQLSSLQQRPQFGAIPPPTRTPCGQTRLPPMKPPGSCAYRPQ